MEIKIENDKFFIKYIDYHPIYFLSIKNVLSFISLYHTKNSLFDDIAMHSVLFSRTFNSSADELISFILEKEIINEEKYNFIKETEKEARENYKEKMMSIISKNYFEKEIKPNIDLLELEDFIDVSIVDQQCINKKDFIKSNISLSNTTEIDKILQELNQKLAIQIEDNIEKFIINDMDNEKTMMLLEPQTTHDLNTVYPLNNIHLLEKQMFEYLEHVDFTNSTLNLGTRIPIILCDSMSFKYFQLNRFFESKKHNKYGKMINKQFIYLPYLDKIKYKYKDILQNKVDKDKLPSLFVVVSYNTNNDNPIKLITTMPQQLDKLNELEYYYRLSFVETGGVETDDSHSIFPDDADAPEKVPTLKYVKKRRTLVCPIFLQFDKNWSALY